MKKKTMRMTMLIGLLVSMFTIGYSYSTINAAVTLPPESELTASYDLSVGSVTINDNGIFEIRQSNSEVATANTITINSNATIYLNGINILVQPPVDKNDFTKPNPININGAYSVNLYLVDETTNKMASEAKGNITSDPIIYTGSGKAGIRVPAGATLNIHGADSNSLNSGTLETRGATGYNFSADFAHGGGGAGIGGNGGYATGFQIYTASEPSGLVNVYGGKITAIGGSAGGYHGHGGNGIGSGGRTLYQGTNPASGKVGVYEGFLTVKGGNKSTDSLSGYGIGGSIDIYQGLLIAQSADDANRAAFAQQPIFLPSTEYVFKRAVSSEYSNTAYILNSSDYYVQIQAEGTPVLTAGSVLRTSDTEGTVKFTTNESGTYYYQVVADGASAPSIDTNTAGTACSASEVTINNPIGLTPGPMDIYIKLKDDQGNVSTALKLDIPAYIRKVASWEELRTAINEAPVGDIETIIEITQNFSSNLSAIYGWNDGTTGKKLVLQSAEGGPYTITRGSNHIGSFFVNDYDLGTMTLKNIILDGNGSIVTADKSMIYKAGGTLIMDSGAIIQNIKAEASGGRGAAITNAGGILIMKAGSTIQNAENTAIAQTGGIYNSGTLVMEGGIIQGCKGDAAGGVYSRNSNVTVSGVVQIIDNQKNNGYDSNFYMDDTSVITIGDAGLKVGSNIGFSKYMSSVPADVTTANSKDYSIYFTSDNLLYTMKNIGTLSNQIVKLVSKTASYTVEHYKQNLLDSGYTLYETENKSGTTDSSITASALTIPGFSENTSHAGRVASATLKYDGSTVLKLYYYRNTDTAYKVEHYKENVVGGYDKILTEDKTGTTDATATAVAKTYAGFSENTSHEGRVASASIEGDGSTVLKLYYYRNTDTAYKVEHYKENLEGGYDKILTEDKTGTTDATATAVAKTYVGFSENTSYEGRVASASIEGDGSTVLKLYYDRDTFTVTFKDYDDSVLKTEYVKYEADGTAPAVPLRENYIFDKWDIDYKGVSDDITVTALYIKLNDPVIDIAGSNKELGTNAEGLEDAVRFSDDERLKDISIKLEVSILDGNTVPEADRSALDSYVKEQLGLKSPSMFLLDISLFKIVDGAETVITETKEEITVRFILPEEYRNMDFYISRVHDGKVENLDYSYDKETFEVTFKTDKFSTYSIIGKPSATVTVLPKTGGSGMTAFVMILAGLTFIGISGLAVKKKD